MVLFEGSDFDELPDDNTEARILIAFGSGFPVLGVAEHDDGIPRLLKQGSELHLTCGPIDDELIRVAMGCVLGGFEASDLPDELAGSLTLTDLAAAIRPGMQPAASFALLADLARRRRDVGDSPQPPKARASYPGSGGVALQPRRGARD